MDVATSNKALATTAIGASLFAPVSPHELYEAVLDVRGFVSWAPGVRRVEVLSRRGRAGMSSEWEISFLGCRRKVFSTLEAAEAPSYLRWTYEGSARGWGRCSIRPSGDGVVANFETALEPTDLLLTAAARSACAREAARSHLKRSLLKLGRLVASDTARVRVGPITAK